MLGYMSGIYHIHYQYFGFLLPEPKIVPSGRVYTLSVKGGLVIIVDKTPRGFLNGDYLHHVTIVHLAEDLFIVVTTAQDLGYPADILVVAPNPPEFSKPDSGLGLEGFWVTTLKEYHTL